MYQIIDCKRYILLLWLITSAVVGINGCSVSKLQNRNEQLVLEYTSFSMVSDGEIDLDALDLVHTRRLQLDNNFDKLYLYELTNRLKGVPYKSSKAKQIKGQVLFAIFIEKRQKENLLLVSDGCFVLDTARKKIYYGDKGFFELFIPKDSDNLNDYDERACRVQ